jgi:hypothetical protein
MVRRIVLPAQPYSTASAVHRQSSVSNGRFAELEQAILSLAMDGALFVQLEGPASRSEYDRTSRLRTTLDRHLRRRYAVLCIPDFDLGGVWVYRPSSISVVVGVLVGPEKEAEVRSRPVED